MSSETVRSDSGEVGFIDPEDLGILGEPTEHEVAAAEARANGEPI